MKKKVLIIDDMQVWLREGKIILEKAGYPVDTFQVVEPERLNDKELIPALQNKLENVDIVLIDKDLGKGIDTTLCCCVIRHHFPGLPIIRWTGGHEREPWMRILGITTINKPTKARDRYDERDRTYLELFPDAFAKALKEQETILAGPMAIYRSVIEERGGVETNKNYDQKRHDWRLRQIQQIAQLMDKDELPVLNENGRHETDYNDRPMYWTIHGRGAGMIMHELGHAICDGHLTHDEVAPYLPALKKVIAKIDVDKRFAPVAEFVMQAEDSEEMELIQHCY